MSGSGTDCVKTQNAATQLRHMWSPICETT